MKALIIANGPLEELCLWPGASQSPDLVVAADGGARHARALNLVPDAVVGDADSLDEETSRWLEAHDVPLVRHPWAKDETDLELALLYAVEAGAEEITVLGALGDRPDQTIANLHLLAHPALTGRRVSLLGPGYRIFLLRDGEQGSITGTVGDTVSLLPLAGEARGIHTTGLRWALQGESLLFGPARGVSNELSAPVAQVRLDTGLLLVVHLSHTAESQQAEREALKEAPKTARVPP